MELPVTQHTHPVPCGPSLCSHPCKGASSAKELKGSMEATVYWQHYVWQTLYPTTPLTSNTSVVRSCSKLKAWHLSLLGEMWGLFYGQSILVPALIPLDPFSPSLRPSYPRKLQVSISIAAGMEGNCRQGQNYATEGDNVVAFDLLHTSSSAFEWLARCCSSRPGV